MISELLQANFIDLDLECGSKQDAIDRLSNLLTSSGKVTDRTHFVKAVMERERLGSTAIGAGIAIPHARANT
ncbi:MAG TPA: PTS sugar transporter subunit IIA, partial [Candidatus Ozemobacteraceae bacterium]|nr:PTS sugar transporter subunit IIA [Candidatus Ozemobacteraceae bacterium]